MLILTAPSNIVGRIRHNGVLLTLVLFSLGLGVFLFLTGRDVVRIGSSLLHFSTVESLAVSPDGRTVAAGYGSLTDDYVVRVWDIGPPTSTITNPTVLKGHQTYVTGVSYSPDGHMLASVDDHGLVLIWNIDDLTAQPITLTAGPGTDAMVISPDGHYLAVGGGDDNLLHVWDLHQIAAPPILLKGEGNTGTSLSFSPDSTMLAAASYPLMRVWYLPDTSGGSIIFRPGNDPILATAFASDSETVAEGGTDSIVRIWDLRRFMGAGYVPTKLQGHSKSVTALAYSPDGSILASGSDDKTIRLWSIGQPNPTSIVLSGHKSRVSSLAFTPDGKTLVSGGDTTIRLWDVQHPKADPTVLSVPDPTP